jgi:hypothetical protein
MVSMCGHVVAWPGSRKLLDHPLLTCEGRTFGAGLAVADVPQTVLK